MREYSGACIIVVLLFLILCWGVIVGSERERQQWNDFIRIHNCKVVEEKKGQTGVGNTTNTNGQIAVVIVTTPDQECWACNDGKRYRRDK